MFRADSAALTLTFYTKFAGMTILGVEHKEKEPAAKALLESFKSVIGTADTPIGNYMGFNMSLQFDSFNKSFSVLLRANMTYQTELGADAFGNITRINNALADLPKKLSGAKTQLETLYQQQEAAKQELEKPFVLAGELADKEARLALLNADLNIDGDGGFDVLNDIDSRDDEAEVTEPPEYGYGADYERYARQPASAKSARPSLMEDLRTFSADKPASGTVKKPTEHDI